MQKNDTLTLTIHDLSPQGDGITTYRQRTLYVPHTLPKEVVKIKVVKVHKRHAFGKLIEVLQPHPHRQASPCTISTQCGGCQLLHYEYQQHLQWKNHCVNTQLAPHPPEIIKPSPKINGFRNKAQLAFQRDRHTLKIGLYARHSHRVVDTPHCHIQHPNINDVICICQEFFKKISISCYDDTTQSGLLRYLVIRTSTINETMVTLVTTKPTIPCVQEWVQTLQKIPHVKSIYLNINDSTSDVILGAQSTLLWGASHIQETLGNTTFQLSLSSFFQLNPYQAQILYDDIKDQIQQKQPSHILDLYCGSGSIGLYVTPKDCQLTGIEITPSAIEDANHNKQRNNLQHATFINGLAEDIYPTLSHQPNCVILDPPRKGCDAIVIDTLIRNRPTTIIYVSCNPVTLQRDLELLTPYYSVESIQPYDMFPFTPHIEVMAILALSQNTQSE